MRIKSCQGFPLHGSPRESQGGRFPLSQHLSLVTSRPFSLGPQGQRDLLVG